MRNCKNILLSLSICFLLLSIDAYAFQEIHKGIRINPTVERIDISNPEQLDIPIIKTKNKWYEFFKENDLELDINIDINTEIIVDTESSNKIKLKVSSSRENISNIGLENIESGYRKDIFEEEYTFDLNENGYYYIYVYDTNKKYNLISIYIDNVNIEGDINEDHHNIYYSIVKDTKTLKSTLEAYMDKNDNLEIINYPKSTKIDEEKIIIEDIKNMDYRIRFKCNDNECIKKDCNNNTKEFEVNLDVKNEDILFSIKDLYTKVSFDELDNTNAIINFATPNFQNIKIVPADDYTKQIVKIRENNEYVVRTNGEYKFKVIDPSIEGSDYICIVNVDIIGKDYIDKASVNHTIQYDGNNKEANVLIDTKECSWLKEIILPSGEIVNPNGAMFSVNKNGEYLINLIDINGSNTPYVIKVDCITEEDNICILASHNIKIDEEKSIANINLTIKEDSHNFSKIVLPDFSESKENNIVYPVYSNGDYLFKLECLDGSWQNYVVKVDNLDNKNIKNLNIEENIRYLDGDIIINLKVEEDIIGIVNPNGNLIESNDCDYVVDKFGKYFFNIKDLNGNMIPYLIEIEDKNEKIDLDISEKIVDNGDYKSIKLSFPEDIQGVVLPDNKFIEGSKVEYNVDVNGKYLFMIKNKDGLVENYSSEITSFDNTNNLIDINVDEKVTYSQDYKKAIIKIKATNAADPIISVMKPDRSIIEGDSCEVTVDKNGDYTFYFQTKGKKILSHVIKVDGIKDGVAKFNIKEEVLLDEKTKKIIIVITVQGDTDKLLGIITPDGKFNKGNKVQYVIDKNGEYVFKIKDTDENISTKTISIDAYDSNGNLKNSEDSDVDDSKESPQQNENNEKPSENKDDEKNQNNQDKIEINSEKDNELKENLPDNNDKINPQTGDINIVVYIIGIIISSAIIVVVLYKYNKNK